MPDTPAFLAERLRAEGDKTLQLFQSLTPQQWQTVVYSEGSPWTMKSVLVHFVTAEKGFLKILPDIAAGGAGASEDFDIDRFNASQQEKSKDLTPQELLDQFREVRAAMAAWVDSLTLADLEKTGRHPFLGPATLSEMIKLIYRHNQLHQRDMRSLE